MKTLGGTGTSERWCWGDRYFNENWGSRRQAKTLDHEIAVQQSDGDCDVALLLAMEIAGRIQGGSIGRTAAYASM